MSDVFPKFVIEDGDLIIANCTYHMEIIKEKANVRGGGFWHRANNLFIFSGKSFQFGAAKIEDIKACIENKRVFLGTKRKNNVSESGFAFDTGSEIITLKSLNSIALT